MLDLLCCLLRRHAGHAHATQKAEGNGPGIRDSRTLFHLWRVIDLKAKQVAGSDEQTLVLPRQPGANAEENEQQGRERMGSGTLATRTVTNGNVEAMKQDLVAPKDIFTWKDVCCDVHIKGETRRILSNVAGYVKPGTLTALMGESGAGKTTLLDT